MVRIRRNMQLTKYILFGIFLFLFSFLLGSQSKLSADICTWDGDTDQFWSTTDNWDCVGGVEANDTLVFPAGGGNASMENDFPANTNFTGLNFESEAYTVTGNSIQIDNGFIEYDDDDSAGTLTFGLDVEITFQYLDLIVMDSYTILDITGDLSGVGDVWKYEDGMVAYSGNNTYTSTTRITNGRLQLKSSTALQNTTVEIYNNSALELVNDISVNTTSIQLDGLGWDTEPNGSARNISGNNTLLGGIILLGSSRSHVESGSLTMSGVVSGNGSLLKTGTSFLILDGSSGNTFTGGVYLNDGDLTLNKSSGLAIPSNEIIVGDTQGTDDTARLIVNTSDQFNSSADITIELDGFLTYENVGTTNNISNITMNEGGHAKLAGTSVISGTIEMRGALLQMLETSSISSNSIFCTVSGVESLIIGDPLTLSASTFTFNTETFNDSNKCRVANIIQGSANIVVAGRGITFDGANTYTGSTTVNDQSFLYVGHNTALGNSSSGTTVISGGAIALYNSVTIASEPLSLSGAGTFLAGTLCSCEGTNNYGGVITLSGASGVLIATISNSVLTISGGITGNIDNGLQFHKYNSGSGLIQLASANTFTASGIEIGDVAVRKTASVNAFPDTLHVGLNQYATLDLNSFSETLGSLGGQAGATVALGNATLSVGANNTDMTFNGIISGNGGITKIGTGIFALTANNNYTGTTNITNGRLLVNGLQSSSNVSLNSTGILGGSGRVGVITGGGTGAIAPGNSPGILNVTGNVAFANTNSFNVEINGTTVGSQYDQLNVTGSVNLNSATLNVSLGFVPTSGNTFTIVESSGVLIGTFNGLPNNSTFSVGGNTLKINYGTNSVIISVDNGGGTGGTGGSNGPGSGGDLADTGIAIPLVALSFLATTTAVVVMTNKYVQKRKRLYKKNFR